MWRREGGALPVVSLLLCWLTQALAGGLFELKIRGFENQFGVDSFGACCRGGERRSARAACAAECATKLRVCLMHYQRVIDERPDCTFGELVTPVIGGNSFTLDDNDSGGNGSFVNPMLFPFNFSWPGTFSLVIEAWHEREPDKGDGASFEARHTLVHRMTKQGWLDAGPDWTHDERRSARHAVLFDYRVLCDKYYFGDKCNVMCKGSASQVFGHYECLEDGSRRCLPGWAGEYCTEAACLPGCHGEHGFCDQPNECRCRAGWEGQFCDVCKRYPGCRNGTCSAAWGCDCLEGWGGLFCNQDLNFCTNHRPCKNGGTCYNTGQGSYTCSCAAGFTGTDCEIEEGGCARHPCLNGGTCRDTGHNFTCVCPRGWSGHRCETAAETCSDKPCKNGGTCGQRADGYSCRCRRGFKGTNCEQRDTFCLPNTCENGGNCVNERDGYRCVCPVGFSGVNCQLNVDDCAVNPCLNGGTCVDEISAFRCLCVPGFVGSVCQVDVDDCLTEPCANGGRCHDRVNNFSCTCRDGFTGSDCSIDVDECAGQQCQNSGTCVDGVGTFECRCRDGFVGDLCQFEGVIPEWARAMATSKKNSPAAPKQEEPLSAKHVVLIAALSVSVPAIVLVALAAILCTKYRRRRAAEKADDEARRQNAENAENAAVGQRKHLQGNMIVNTLHFPSEKLKNVDDPLASPSVVPRLKQVNVDPACLSALNSSCSSSGLDLDSEDAGEDFSSSSSCGRSSSVRRGRASPHRTADDTRSECGEDTFATQV